MNSSYPADSRSRVQLAHEHLEEFVRGIPVPTIAETLSALPRRKGFRPGKDTDIKLKAFLHKVDNWSDNDWMLFGRLWAAWTQSHAQISRLITEATRKPLADSLTAVVESCEDLAAIVRTLVNSGDIAREDISTWHTFGPFPSDSLIASLIQRAPTSRDLALLARVSDLERLCRNLKSDLEMLGSAQSRDLARVSNRTGALEKDLVEVHGELAMRPKQSSIDALSRQLTTALERCTQDVERMESRVSAVADALGRASQECDNLREAQGSATGTVAKLEQQLCQLELSIKPFAESIAASAAAGPGGSRCVQTIPGVLEQVSRTEGPVEPVTLSTIAVTMRHLHRNLNNLGLALPHAKRLAQDVLCAVAIGQLVTFKGTMALPTAECCAMSLTAGEVCLMSVPVGLIDPSSEISDYLGRSSQAANQLRTLILEGANRSAMDAYGACVQHRVRARVLAPRLGVEPLVFAVLSDGPASLTTGTEYLELGPVIDTDALTWTGTDLEPLLPGRSQESVLTQIVSRGKVSDFEGVPEWLVDQAGATWLVGVGAALATHQNLAKVEDPRKAADALSLALFGWVVPMALELDSERVSDIAGVEQDARAIRLVRRYGAR